jgi:hypothetical protein
MKLNNTSLSKVDNITLPICLPADRDEAAVQARYLEYLSDPSITIKKLPYIYVQSFDVNDPDSFFRDRPLTNTPIMSEFKDITLREHNKTKERLVNIYQKGANMRTFGRMRGNMQYLEDAWDIQIQPISFQYAHTDGIDLYFTPRTEMKIRDKYIKIRVKYTGTQYAIINAIKTLFTISYA